MIKIIMRLLPGILLLSLSLGCSLFESEAQYPDCISKPSNPKESRGCIDIFVYQFLDSSRALVAEIDPSKIALTKRCQTFQLGNPDLGISVRMEVSRGDPDSVYFNYCNDFGLSNLGTPIVYTATAGTFTFSVSEDNPIKEWKTNNVYYITIRIENLHLLDHASGAEVVINEIVFWNVAVGWSPPG